jgi:hypothetical protein
MSVLAAEERAEPSAVPSSPKNEATSRLIKGTLDFKKDEEMEKKMRNLWIIDGQAYDFRDFVKRHPGGSAAISLGRGLDCTELFRTYHLMKTPPESILKKYRVPNPVGMTFEPSKYSFEEDGFLMTIRRRGKDYFSPTGSAPRAASFGRFSAS